MTPGNNSASVVMTISTTAPRASLQEPGSLGGVYYAVMLMLPGLVVIVGKQKSKTRLVSSSTLAFVICIALLSLPSCGGASSSGGGGGGQPGTPPGNYTVTVTAASGSITHTITVGLVVQ